MTTIFSIKIKPLPTYKGKHKTKGKVFKKIIFPSTKANAYIHKKTCKPRKISIHVISQLTTNQQFNDRNSNSSTDKAILES